MRKLSIALAAIFLFAVPALAQRTVVSGTVKDVNGIAYAGGTLVATLSLPVGVSGATLNGVQIGGATQRVTLDGTGSFLMQLPDNNVVQPGGTQWTFNVNISPGAPPPLGTGPQNCSATLTITGASQSINSSFSGCPALSNGGGGSSSNSIPGIPGLTAVPVTSGLLAEYRILAGETPSGLIDYSGNSRNATGTVGTAPTSIAVTGGIQCNANGAVILPASVNAALDVFVYMGFQTNWTISPQWMSPLIGGGAPANSAGITLANYQLNPSPTIVKYNNIIEGVAAGGVTQYSVPGVNGVAVVEWKMSSPSDRFFVNGAEVSYNPQGAATSSAGVNTSPFQICGGAAGSGLATQTYFQGQVYYVAIYNRVLNASEGSQTATYLINTMGSRSVPIQQQLTSISGDQMVFEGDSITAGSVLPNTNQVWTASLLTLSGINIINSGFSSKTANMVASTTVPTDQNFSQKGAQRNGVMLWLGTNDVSGAGFTPAQAAGNISSIVRSLKSYGFTVFLSTMIARSGFDANKNTLNTFLRTNWRTIGADALVDMAADPNLGADGAALGATYFLVDNVHPNATANFNDVAPTVARAINRKFGNQDASTATTYSSAAAAAVATTAGSESGNTLTITFAATPANCQAGNHITLTGITPAGYNSVVANGAGPGNTFTILTRTATQITAFDNTTGLGAITVQGTGVCPQTQDADGFAILNFGAGNHTLDSAVGYTGQCITRQNINAAASTLVPLGTETITGAGATPTTVAANTTAVLCSQLVSPSAAGANWVRTQ